MTVHYFVIIRHEGEEIIVDPNYRYFFEPAIGHDFENDIFVGDRNSLHSLFLENSSLIFTKKPIPPFAIIEKFVDFTWGFGDYNKYRTIHLRTAADL